MKKTVFVLLFLGLGTVLVSHWVGESRASGRGLAYQYEKIRYVLSVIRELYVEEPDLNALAEGAINGMLEKLDPHSVYLPPKDQKDTQEKFSGQFEGIGIYFEINNKILTVVSAIPGTPSDRLGLSPGDQIVEIEGKSTYGITNQEVQKKLKGPRGTQVSIKVRRPGLSKLLDSPTTREKIPIFSVESSFLLDDHTGYVHINRFMATTDRELAQALDSLEALGMDQLILDLRNNPGGYLQQAIAVADFFLPPDRVIVSTRGRLPQFDEVHRSTGLVRKRDYPVIVLLNHGSASASEIVSGALQDWDRALIVGSTSFGKGLVQRPVPLGDSSAVRITIARYYTPTGRLIQRPYKDGIAQYIQAGWDDEDPNENPDSLANKPVFTTPKGRRVYGGGGITPDIRVDSGLLTVYAAELLRKRRFFEFATQYKIDHPAPGESAAAFIAGFQVSDALLKEFLEFAEKEVPLVEKDLEKDLPYIRNMIKAELSRVYWGRGSYYAVRALQDRVIQEALELMDDAEEMLTRW